MTNNPTIDGVSRPKGCCCPPPGHTGMWAAAKCPVHFGLRAMTAAPVVERQTVEVPVVGKLVPNGGGYDCWHPAANQGQAVVRQSDHDEYVAALQSAIAQLQARVEELEDDRAKAKEDSDNNLSDANNAASMLEEVLEWFDDGVGRSHEEFKLMRRIGDWLGRSVAEIKDGSDECAHSEANRIGCPECGEVFK